jgi:hypothetical protein
MRFTPAAFLVFYETRVQVEKDNNFLENHRFGMVCATIATVFGKKKYKSSDFFQTKEKKPQTAYEMADVLKALTIGLGGTVIE